MVAAAVVAVVAAVLFFILLRGGDDTSEARVFGDGLGVSSTSGATEPNGAEPSDSAAEVAATQTEAQAPDEPGGQDPDLAVDENALLFDSSVVTGIAAAVSQQVYPDGNADEIILTSANPSGDALAAGSLVGLFDTTLLLTDADELSPATAAEIDRLGDPRVHILGGPEAVSVAVEEALVAAGHDVHRHAGPRQAHTAVDIAGAHFPDARTAVLVQTPDRTSGPVGAIASALSATNLAAVQELPVLLTDGDSLTDTTEMYLEGSFIKQVIVVGSEDSVSAEVTSRLRELGIDWLRWSGDNRFDTAVKVAENRGFRTLESAESVILVEGGLDAVWPAGFLGAIQASLQNGPVLLTDGDTLPEATTQYLQASTPGDIDVLCTPGVTRRACAAAMNLIGGSTSE